MKHAALILCLALGAASGLAAQHRNAVARPLAPSSAALSPPSGVSIQSTPVLVEMRWQPVPGAALYRVERGLAPSGPWVLLAEHPAARLTTPSPLAPAGANGQGQLYYYRISAVPAAGEAASTIVPWVTPSLEAPVVAAWRQERADLVVYWTPSPGAIKYMVTVNGGPPVDVAPQVTTLRLPNLSPGGNQGATVAVAVHASFAPSIVAPGPATTIVLAPVNRCWPLAQLPPGPGPQTGGLYLGVTSIGIFGVAPPNSGAAILYERAVSGSSAWETLGCNGGGVQVYDINL